jgi:hypothetical protein
VSCWSWIDGELDATVDEIIDDLVDMFLVAGAAAAAPAQ